MNSLVFTTVMVLAGLYGLCIGSFLNVVVYRLPRGIKMTNDRSHCPTCGNMIRFYDNIPLLSYLILRGKCRHCKSHISLRYPLVECANTVGWLLAFWIFKDNYICAGCVAVAFSVLLCICLIDAEHMIIHDRFQIILLVLGVIVTVFDTKVSVLSHIIGGVAGFGVFLLLGILVSKAVGKEALGGGDIKLAGVMGLFLGGGKLLLGCLIASFSALIYILIRRIRHQNNEDAFPFGPFLGVGFTVAMLAGDCLIQFYFSLLGI